MAVRTEDQVASFLWATGSRLRSVTGDLLDLILPPMTLDGGARALTGGLSAEAWGQVTFRNDPVSDGCGQSVLLLADQPHG